MNDLNFINKLNSISKLSERFKLVRSYQDQLVSEGENGNHCLADDKVLFSFQNYKSMEKGYCPFSAKDSPQLSESEKLFLEQYRIGVITNPLIAGYYCDVFTNAQNKRNSKYADSIIENYLKVIQDADKYIPADVAWVLKSLIYNCQAYNKKRKEEVIAAVESFLSSQVPLFYKFRLLVNTHKFEYLNATQIRALSSKYQLHNYLSDFYDDNASFFKMLLGCIPSSDQTTIKAIYYKLAENEESIIKKQPFDCTISQFLLRKCQYLELGGFEDEAEDCFKLYIKAKTSPEGMERVEQKGTFQNSFFQGTINAIINSPSPFLSLAFDDALFQPDIINQDKLLSEVQSMGMKITFIDRNGNPHPGEGYYSNKVLQIPDYSFYELFTAYPIQLSLKSLIERGDFTADNLLDYLASTWIGWQRLPVNHSLRESQESWIDTMRHPITTLCHEISSEIMSEGSYKGNYMCAIDSLVVKIEGCIREACWRLGINTVNPKNNDELTLEKLFDKIESFQNRHQTTVVVPQTLELLRNILTKQGKNLRNDIAHGFTSLGDYTLSNAIAVLHCLLRLSAMKVSIET